MPISSHRKRLRQIERAGDARYLTFSCYGRLPLFQNDAIKRVFVERLRGVRVEHSFRLFAWVIMPEHVHMLIAPNLPEHPVRKILRALKRPVAERVVRRWRELEAPVLRRITDDRGAARFWLPGGGYDRNIINGHELPEKVAYVHANPVRRGLAGRPEDWAWSSARWYAGQREGQIPIDPVH